MRSKIAVLHKQGDPLIIERVEFPTLKPGQILVKMKSTGICRSQLNEINGLKGEDKYLPHTLGHEGGGIVEDVGNCVTKVSQGDHVVLTWIKGNGMDVLGTEYFNQKENINAGPVTTFGQYTIASENRVVPVSKNVPFEIMSLLGCAVPTGGGIILNQIKPLPGESIAVIGVGGVGSSTILLAKLMNCHPIIAIDINDEKLEYAKTLGATKVFNSRIEDFKSNIEGIDYIVEAVGNTHLIEQSLEAVKWDGGLVIIAGNPPYGNKISIDPFSLMGKKIAGSWGGSTNPDVDILGYIKLYQTGKLPLEKLITNRFTFQEINSAFEQLENNKIIGRGVIEF